ncbi:MAG: class I SAM-dependent methyltransferase [Vampirovibrionales bacterium]|nr:class I SAM-dependent methyltransferase [Vampirovibrionales bacterium]
MPHSPDVPPPQTPWQDTPPQSLPTPDPALAALQAFYPATSPTTSNPEAEAKGQDYVWNASQYQQKNAFVFQMAEGVLRLLDPKPGEQILDIGCGTGQLTARLADAGIQACGLDASPDMLAQARQNRPDIPFTLGDVRSFRLHQRFDAIFSNAALHWVAEHDQVAAAVYYHLKPGGRFVAELGGIGNLAAMIEAIEAVLKKDYGLRPNQLKKLNPWTFPTLGQFAVALESQGLQVVESRLFERLTPLADGEKGMQNWLEAFLKSYWQALPAQAQPIAIEKVIQRLKPMWYDRFEGKHWCVDYVRLQIKAIKPKLLQP